MRPITAMARSARRQINQDDVRVLSKAIEQDLLAVGRDVETLHLEALAQVREPAEASGGEIEQPEVEVVVANPASAPAPCPPAESDTGYRPRDMDLRQRERLPFRQ